MEKDFHKLVFTLSTSTISTDVLHNLTSILKQQNAGSIVSFILKSFQSILSLEQWTWKLLSEDNLQWINGPAYLQLFYALASFNRLFIFDCDTVDNDSKKNLLLPESIDQIERIFQHIEQINDDNNPYFTVISSIFENQATFLLEHLEYCKLPVVNFIGEYFVRNYIMSKQFKQYLKQLQQTQTTQTKITSKMLFYIKTCSFYFYVYLPTKYQNFFYPIDEMTRYFGDDYLRIVHKHVPTITKWNEEFLACIAHLIALACRCSWWDGVIPSPMKILLPTEQTAYEHVQDLMSIIAHVPFYHDVKSQRSNDKTILIESCLMFLLDITETQTVYWLFRSNESYQKILLNVAESLANDIICLAAYDVLSVVLADEQIKELKISDSAALFSFTMLEKAWHNPSKLYKQIPIIYILQGVRNLLKNDSVQQKIADFNQIPLFLEMCDDYPIVYDILWALSFNQDIQQQLRANTSFMSKLAHLARECDNSKTCKIIHGLLWNLESHSETDPILPNNNEETFDLMISYSHKDKELCKQLYDELIKVGYRVWIDFDQMHGNVMDAMAHAIEQSQIVIICLSEDYRKSNYCRAEAHYAFQRQRKIVPVLLQKHYKPDGWLLFLIGQLHYVDFTKHGFSQAITMLFKELRLDSRKEHANLITSDQLSSTSKTSSSLKLPQNILLWSSKDVQAWLIRRNLQQMARLLVGCDGRSLVYLNRFMKISDSEQILKLLQSDAQRRIGEDISLIELSCFRSLMDKRQRLAVSSTAPKTHEKASTDTNIDSSLNSL